ncbi:molybdenum cofactor guanylyltransferase [Dethiothermospora halolimnae]|uniref:molybdenum cofactor guanylyltransferase n=1 Tax=Dethiothermospora halolimnae TaxID=3114390 RepID=UPI003CCC072A
MELFKSAAILAGGKSSRMGFDKQFLKVNERRVIDGIISNLKKEFDEIIVVTNKPEKYLGIKSKIVTDRIEKKGPLSGIHAALSEANSKYVYFTACDMPNINIDYIRYMKKNIMKTKKEVCVTKIRDWIEPFNGFYSVDILPFIEGHLYSNKRSILSLIKNLNCLYIEEVVARKFSPNWDMFLNLNTKDDLNSYIRRIKNE